MSYAPLVIQDYDPEWEVAYEKTKVEIIKVAGKFVTAVEHIGSTAVVGLAAKPLIDILVAPRRFPEDVEQLVDPLASIGFEYVPKPETDKFFFRRGPWGHGSHHLHLAEFDGEVWTDLICFRDYLRTQPQSIEDYANLKRRLAAKYGSDRPSYTTEKTEFIKTIVELAADA